MGGENVNPDGRRNVVLVTADSLRADHCGFLGGTHGTTPNLDRFARDGIVFENAIAPGPRTPSSMPVAFTGAFIDEPPMDQKRWKDRRNRIARHLNRYRTIPKRLACRGYSTAGLTVNPWTARDTGFDNGFGTFEQSPSLDEAWPVSVRLLDRIIRLTDNEKRFNWYNKQDWLAQWTQFYDRILELATGLDEPYFLWVFLLDTHQPYIAPSEYREETNRFEMYYAALQYWNHLYRRGDDTLKPSLKRRLERSYRDAVRSIDGFVGRLFEDLGTDDPVFIVHSDHGEAFGKHGEYGHQQTLYEENLHVPLLIANCADQKRIREPVSLRSLPDIVMSVARGEIPVSQNMFVIAETEDERGLALRTRVWKYIVDREGERLFDLRKDSNEQRNVLEALPDVSRVFRSIADRHRLGRTERRAILGAVTTLCEEGRL